MSATSVINLSIFVCLAAFVNSNFVGKHCIINDSLPGVCQSIYDCPPVLSVFLKRPLTRETKENVKRLQCGFDKFTPLVCCSSQLNLGVFPDTDGRQNTIHPAIPSEPLIRPVVSTAGRGGIDLLPDRSVCGIGNLNNKILGGEKTDLDEFPWMVLLGYDNGFSNERLFQCGGVLISNRYILTAAHCVTGEILRKIGRLDVVRFGEYDVRTNPDCVGPRGYERCAPPYVDIRVEKAIPHKGFSDRNTNRKDDIALVRLGKEVQFSDFVQPICLPNANTKEITKDERLYVAGWGRTLNGKYSDVKIKLAVPIFEKSRCESMFSRARVSLVDGQLCAGGQKDRDACKGDSGGPLMKEEFPGTWVTMGVVSFGYGCGMREWPGVYTNVSNYMNWILENIEP